MWHRSLNTPSAGTIFNPTRRACLAHSHRLGAKRPIYSFAMTRESKSISAPAVLSDNGQSQEQHTVNNAPANSTSGDVIQPADVPIEGQKRSLDTRSRPQHGQQQTAQRPQLTSQSNTSGRPIRQSRRPQQKSQRDAWSNAQEVGYTGISHAPAQTYPSFNNYNYNHNANPASGPYMAGNDFSYLQNQNNMNNFGLGLNYAVPGPFNQTGVPSALQQAQLLHIQFAQQMFMSHQALGTIGNGLPFNNNNGMQQMRSMSTMVNPVAQPLGQTPAFDPNISTPDVASKDQGRRNLRPPQREAIEPPVAPVPSPLYLDAANKEPQDLYFFQPLLIILDLNGTLLYRKRKRFPPQFIRRPALNYFLERITSRHKIMVWSSSRPQTVNEICKDIFSEKQQEKLVAKWGRDKLGLTTKQYNSKVQVYKQLEKVWEDPRVQSSYPTKKQKQGKSVFHVDRYDPGILVDMEMTGAMNKCWDQSNTVLIDDSSLKAAGNPYNILEVPEFTNMPNDDDDTVLKAVLKMIKILAKSNDVSRRLRAWKEQGIRINRDDVLEFSDSQSDDTSAAEERKIAEAVEEEPYYTGNMVFNTDKDIVPVGRSKGPSIMPSITRNKRGNLTKKEARKAKVSKRRAEKRAEKAAKKEAETEKREARRQERKYRKETRLAWIERNKSASPGADTGGGPSPDLNTKEPKEQQDTAPVATTG